VYTLYLLIPEERMSRSRAKLTTAACLFCAIVPAGLTAQYADLFGVDPEGNCLYIVTHFRGCEWPWPGGLQGPDPLGRMWACDFCPNNVPGPPDCKIGAQRALDIQVVEGCQKIQMSQQSTGCAPCPKF
jgi:hypothetical protein